MTAAESSRLDAASSIAMTDLMRRAGVAAAHQAVVRYGIRYGSRVVVLAGPGNNGGDAYVVATALARRGAAVSIVPFGSPQSEAAVHHGRRAGTISRIVPEEVDLIVDGLFGAGSRPGVPEQFRHWGEAPAPILSLDLPSGLDADTGEAGEGTFRADCTVAFHSLKPGHVLGDGPDHCGDVVVADIGLEGGDPSFLVVEASDAPRPSRLRRAHKWSAGSVLVVGGSRGMIGAAVMAARSALRFGAGAVGIATPDPGTAQLLAPEILAFSMDDLPGGFDTWVVGPGLANGHEELVAHAHDRAGPTVIDAGALRPVAPGSGHEDIVLTPHEGERRRMGDISQSHVTVLRKGNPTVIEGEVPWIVNSGGPELATIGTGDVLAGMVGALLARGSTGPEAARSAAYWHGVAGAWLQSEQGFVTADALADAVGRFAWSTP